MHTSVDAGPRRPGQDFWLGIPILNRGYVTYYIFNDIERSADGEVCGRTTIRRTPLLSLIHELRNSTSYSEEQKTGVKNGILAFTFH